MKAVTIAAMLLLPAAALAHSDDYPSTAQGALDERAINAPERNSLYSCDAVNMPVPILQPWVEGNTIDFSKKPGISGDAHWDGVIDVGQGLITGNGLPKHPTGNFPVRDADALKYDRNPNRIGAQDLHFELPLNPTIAERPSCLHKGPIGIMLTGAVLFDALDAQNRDAVATELFDKCEGHPERNGMYHYHHYSPCFDSGPKDQPSPLLGYALDGFGIYGPRGSKGHMITNAELDECHGMVSEVADGSGKRQAVYHYVLNNEFPYSLGCYKGTSIDWPGAATMRGKPRRPPPLVVVAQKLGISVEELHDALGPPPPDLHEAARKLGISFEELRDALGPPPEGPPP